MTASRSASPTRKPDISPREWRFISAITLAAIGVALAAFSAMTRILPHLRFA